MLKPLVIEGSALETVNGALANQKIGSADTRLLNKDQQIWKIKPDATALVYIPRDAQGNIIFESAPQLDLRGLGQYGRSIRLTDGISGLEAYGISGTTNAAQAVSECYELHRLLVNQAMVAEGLDPSKNISTDEYRRLLVQYSIPERAVQYAKIPLVAFPIIEIKVDDQTQMPVVSNGNLVTETFWMLMSQKRFDENFSKDLHDYTTETIAGNFLRFSYLLSQQDANKDDSERNMAAGKAFRVALRGGASLFGGAEQADEVRKYLDNLAAREGYTKEAIRTSLDSFALYTDEDVNAAIDKAMLETRARLEVARTQQLGGVGASANVQTQQVQQPAQQLQQPTQQSAPAASQAVTTGLNLDLDLQ